MTRLQTGRLVDAARYTERHNAETHQIAAWNQLQEVLTPEQIDAFFATFRAGPTKPAPTVPPMADLIAQSTPKAFAPALKIIQEFEGFRTDAYPDPGTGGDPWTIGWGSTSINGRPVRKGDVINRAQGDEMLRHKLEAIFIPGTAALIKPWASLRSNQQAALVSWAYNVGLGAVVDSTLRKRLNAGEDPITVAREELPKWNKGGNGVMAGLTRRRAAEVALFTSHLPKLTVPAQQLITISGMVGPKKTPRDFGMKPNDTHLIVNDRALSLTAYTESGYRLFLIPALARGQGADDQWEQTGTDTPPGIYKLGRLYDDVGNSTATPSYSKTLAAYGYMFFDMIELENQEAKHGRSEIGLHGGGSALGWPGAWAPYQKLIPTLGCVRARNADLRDRILPLYRKGTVFVSVFQEAKGTV